MGRTSDRDKALVATNYVEDNTMCYIGLCYDLLDPSDRIEFESKLFCPYVEDEDTLAISEVKHLCGS